MELTPRVIHGLRMARDSVNEQSQKISEAFAEAERTGDYSDADELAADYREHLHEEFESLLDMFVAEYPALFEEGKA